MRIDPYIRDLPKFQGDLARSLDSPDTRLYLDTSTLMWLVRLSRAARAEFMAWCAARDTFVPVWAAHEFQRHLLMGTVRTNMAKVVAETASKQREFAQIAAEQADDALCLAKGYGQRSGYISEIQRLMASFHQLGRVLEVDDERLRSAADDVIEFVNLRTLSSDLDSIIAELSTTGDFRLNHRVPPGYKDSHKDENALGDTVIWREILQEIEHVTRRQPRGWFRSAHQAKPVAGVLISRDEKTDWISSSFVRKPDGNVVKSDRELELDVALPHPMLGHEFERRGGTTFFLVHPAALSGIVETIQKKGGLPSTVAAWRAASLRPDVLEKLLARAVQDEKKAQANAKATTPRATQPAPIQPTSISPPTSQPAVLAALGAISARDVMRVSIAQSIEEFVAASTQGRDELLTRWQNSVTEGTLPGTRLGRILCGVASAAASGMDLAQVPALLEALQRLLPRFADQLLLGALCAAFFDKEGQSLQRPQITLAGVLLPLEDTASSDAAFSALRRMLDELGVSLPYAPGSKQKVKVACTVGSATTSQPALLQDLRLGGQAVLVDGLVDDHPRRLSILLGSPQSHQCKGPLLLGLLSREYLVPLARLELSGISDGKAISWRSGAGLLPIDTNAPNGIGELNDEDLA